MPLMTKYLFVTGKLAAEALQHTLDRLELEDDYRIAVLGYSVAALMKVENIARRLPDAGGCGQVMVPGLCRGDLSLIEQKLGVPVVRGPKDLKDLPAFFGQERTLEGYGEYRVRILAEIVEAYALPWEEILSQAEYYRRAGADVIDLGCPTEGDFPAAGEVVRGLKERGFTVSIDTFDPEIIARADAAGVDLLLSVNSHNLDMVPKLRCKVVVIPDFGEGLESLEENVRRVEKMGACFVADPILDPLSFGFVESVNRFYEFRRRHPDVEMLMGLGNLTELTDADSIGINALMAGVITELGIDYVLTTEVISWARGSVRELDLARRLMFYAHEHRMLPKSLDENLIVAKDPPFEPYTEEELRHMQAQIKDPNYRIFIDGSVIYVFNHRVFVRGTDPQELHAQIEPEDSAHAFYLGRELERAALALRLGKKYMQESPLRWGYLDDDVRRQEGAGA
ncbi:MAG: DUF6513 domain-containing protein [Thermoleophilia bacterium]